MAPIPERMNAYVAALPQGLDSYATHQVKAAVLMNAINRTSIRRDADVLPPVLVHLIRSTLAATSWLPEAHVTAVWLAIRDLYHPDDESYLRFIYEGNRELLSGVVYGLLFKLIGIPRLLAGAGGKWGQMHRGIGITVTSTPETLRAALRLDFPPGLVPPLVCKGYSQAFRAAMEIAGGKDVQLALTDFTTTRAMFEATWR
ncbi:MAG: hypothetical protein AB2A00_02930 [Myxococcota bacterium]